MLNTVDLSETINNCATYNFVATELRILKNVYVAGFVYSLCMFIVWWFNFF